MERLDVKNLGSILGIDSPWAIKSFSLDPAKRLLNIHISLLEKKSFFSFRDSQKSDDGRLIEGQWRYMTVGGYDSIIHASVPTSLAQSESRLSRVLVNQFAFLGHPTAQYSNFLRQKIAIAHLKGLDTGLMSDCLSCEESLIDEVLHDISKAPSSVRSLAVIPTEIDSAWEKILADESGFETDVLPLKLLLTKLRRDDTDLREKVIEVRKFFIENASILEREIERLCGIRTGAQKRSATAAKNKLKLVLPPIKNPVWLDILSGKTRLNSTSVPLNLLISRQRTAFITGKSKQEKVEAIETLRSYFRKNYRSLKSEFMLLNRAMQQRERNVFSLPNSDHGIWQKILLNHDFLPSDNMAYKLLLSKLKAQISIDSDPVVKLDAASKVREFLRQNQKSMQKELSVLVKHTAAQ